MKYYRLCFTFFLFMTIKSLAVSPSLFNIAHWQTEKGADVFFVPTKEVPIVDICLIFAAGSAYDHNQWGISNLTSNLLGEGTTQHSANEISTLFDSLGAKFNTNINRDMSSVCLRSLSEEKYFRPAFSTFQEIIAHSQFSEETFNRVKNQTLYAIKQRQEDPANVAEDVFYQLLFGNTFYGHPLAGDSNSVSKLTLQDVNAFLKKYFVAKNADIILVGDLTLEKSKNLASLLDNALFPGEKATLENIRVKSNVNKKTFISFPSKQNTILLGQIGIAKKNPHYFPLLVGNHILGGGSMVSQLFEKVRNQGGLAYGVSSEFLSLAKPGPFIVSLQTRSDKAPEALNMATLTLRSFITQGPTENMLMEAKKNLINSFPLKIASNADILENVANIAFYHLPLDYLQQYSRKINAVTKKQIKDVFYELINPDQLNVVEVGNKK